MEDDKYKNLNESDIEELDSFIRLVATLDRELELYAIGGTAMVLSGHKPATKDIDFLTTLKQSEIKGRFDLIELKEIDTCPMCNKWRFNEKRLDIFYTETGMIMGFPLTDNWKENSKLFRKAGKTKIFILNWEDIISTKLARGENRDFEDILKILENEDIDFEKFEFDFKERADVCAGNTTRCYENLEELKQRIKDAKA